MKKHLSIPDENKSSDHGTHFYILFYMIDNNMESSAPTIKLHQYNILRITISLAIMTSCLVMTYII